MVIAIARLSYTLLFISFSAAVLIGQTWISNPSFRGISPFVTTQEEVTKILGKPNRYGHYELPEGKVIILYRETKCAEQNNTCFCLAPVGTVLEITVFPNKFVRINQLHLNRKGWQRTAVSGDDVPGITSYHNRTKGIEYEVSENKLETSRSRLLRLYVAS